MDLVKIIKSKKILQKAKKARPVKAQITTSIENDVNKTILSKGEEVVNPVCTYVLKEKGNDFSLVWQHVWVWACGGAEVQLQKMNGWALGRGKAMLVRLKLVQAMGNVNTELVIGSYRASVKMEA